MAQSARAKRPQRGITLIELMVAAAAAIVLASIALPAFTGYVQRARVSRAVGDIGTIAVQVYRWQLSMRAFPITLEQAGLGGRVDPWGNPYRYLRIEGSQTGQRRKDKNLVPINTDFDLYSAGADGVSVSALTAKTSADDVIRANNGAYIGLATNY